MASIREALARGVQYQKSGDLQTAERIYREILEQEPHNADALNFLGMVARQLGNHELAIDLIGRAIAVNPNWADFHNNLGNVFKDQGHLEKAAVSYRRALQLKADYAEAHYNLGTAVAGLGRWDQAVASYQSALLIRPDFATVHNALGTAYKNLGRFDQAVAGYQRAVKHRPDYARAHINLGNVLKMQGKLDEAVTCYRRALRINPSLLRAHTNLCTALQSQGNIDEAIQCCEEALTICPIDRLRFMSATFLPVIYESMDQMEKCRRRLIGKLSAMQRQGATLDAVRDLISTMFYLPYQGKNDRKIQEMVGRLFEQSSEDCPRIRPKLRQQTTRIRVGFVSSFLRFHTIGRLWRGVIAKLSYRDLSVAVLALDKADDWITRFLKQHVDDYIQLPQDLIAARRTISELDLDVLVFTDIGMTPASIALASSRLARVQCATWGHPVTSGLSTVDYFISSKLIEPKNAQQHYTEKLVQFESLGNYYYPLRPQESSPSRRSFGLSEDWHIYLCPQSLFKMHPEFDASLGEILRADPEGRVVLLDSQQSTWRTLLESRFHSTIPDVADRIHFVKRQENRRFLDLLANADVMLDTLHFGGGNTSYEALGLGIPLVTLPAAYMRGRISYGLYQKMGQLQCVASDAADYVRIAVKLGTDESYRRSIRQQILETSHLLFEDATSVDEYERFIVEATRKC